MTYGDQSNTNIYVVDGLGAFDAVSGQSGANVTVSLGLAGITPIWINSTWTQITNGWNGTIVANDTQFAALFTSLGTNPIDLELNVRITDNAGRPITYANPIISLYNSGVVGVVTVPPTIGPSRDGHYSIPSLADSGAVTGLGLPITPRRVYVTVHKPAGGYNIFANVVDGTLTTDGFQYNLSGQTDSPNYRLEYLILF